MAAAFSFVFKLLAAYLKVMYQVRLARVGRHRRRAGEGWSLVRAKRFFLFWKKGLLRKKALANPPEATRSPALGVPARVGMLLRVPQIMVV